MTHALPQLTRRAAAAGIAAGLLLSPLAPLAAAQDDDPIRVVASFSVLADIVGQVGGEHVEVTSLVPVGGDAHTFDPAPDQVTAIADADLVVEVGGDFEPWLDDLVEASGSEATRFQAFAELLDDEHADEHDYEATPEDHAHEAAEAEHDHDAEAEGHDEEAHGDELHHWLDVRNTAHMVTHLVETLASVDPDSAEAYAANGEAYIAELEELDAYIVEQSESIPEERRLLVTTHQSFGAFADRYGYEIPGVLLESHTTEGADAPAGHVAELAGVIEERGIPAVFPDTPGGEDQLAPLADAAGVEIAPPLYVDTLGEEGSGAESYIAMMRHNIDTIAAALGD